MWHISSYSVYALLCDLSYSTVCSLTIKSLLVDQLIVLLDYGTILVSSW